MAKYTIELRNIINIYNREEVENWFKDYNIEDYLTKEQINVINEAGIWSKNKLARKIVDHYFMREIGLETPALFRHYAKVIMQEIMEEKLPLIYSNSIQYNPLINVDYKEIYEREIADKGEANSTSNTNASGLTVNSDTPQGQISKTGILQGEYASNTNAGESTNSTTDKSNTSTSSNETSTKHVVGNSGVSATNQAMIKQFRQNIINIDKDIIKELNILFMGLY